MCKVHGLLCNNIAVAILRICAENFVLTCCTNVNALFTISKCFSVLTTLLISSNPLTRVEGDTSILEVSFGLDLGVLSFFRNRDSLFSNYFAWVQISLNTGKVSSQLR